MSNPPTPAMLEAAENADWQQVVLNGGPPCFHMEEHGRFCLRAHKWDGHKTNPFPFHEFVSFSTLLSALLADERERCARVAETQREYWTAERAARGNYKVMSAMSECKRVADAIRSPHD